MPMHNARSFDAPHRARVLVADDDSGVRSVCRVILQSAGFDVDLVADGYAARRALEAERYDLLLTDNHMPGLSGLELIDELRAAHADLPVILMSGNTEAGELAEQTANGLAAFLPKPFAVHDLINTVQKACARAATHVAAGVDP